MRLAVLADIHGNLPALEAALKEIDQDPVDSLIVAGDMVTGPQPVEVIDRLRARDARMIRGNHENYILQLASGEAPEWQYTARQWAFIRWNHRQMDEASLDFIKSLDEQLTVHCAGTAAIRVVHGSPRSVSELIYPEKDREALTTALAMVSEAVLIFGHTHEPWQMRVNGQLALNPGSVCGTFDGRMSGGYAILSWENGRWQAELKELRYDFALIQKAFEQTGLLKEGGPIAECWLYDLKTGTNTLPRFVAYAYQQAAEAGYADSPFVPDEIWDQASISFKKEHR